MDNQIAHIGFNQYPQQDRRPQAQHPRTAIQQQQNVHNIKETKVKLTHVDDAELRYQWNTSKSVPQKRHNATNASE